MFDHLPYLAHLENPAIKDVGRDGVIDNVVLQKYPPYPSPIDSDDSQSDIDGGKSSTRFYFGR